MSERPRSVVCLTQAIQNDNFQREGFHKFFDCWLVEQGEHLKNLIAASEGYQTCAGATPNPVHGPIRDQAVDDSVSLRPIIKTVVEHYEQYYRAKSTWAKHDAAGILSPEWRSSLEDAFAWIGGWRPCVAIHLLYSKSGLQLEAKLTELVQGLTTWDLGDLSSDQLAQVDGLQKTTITQERQITETMATLQQTVADSSMVELSHALTQIARGAGESDTRNGVEARIEETLTSKEDGLEEVLQKADDLRLTTLKAIIHILTPIQAVHFLIAAAELHLQLHEWGKNREARHGQPDEQIVSC